MKTSCISHPKKNPLVIIRGWQMDVFGAAPEAALCSFFEHYHNVKLDNRPQSKKLNEIAKKHGDDEAHDTSCYQYHTEAELESGIMGIAKRTRVRAAVKKLEKLGVVSIHRNPNKRYSFDRTNHYLFHPDVVTNMIEKWKTGKKGQSAGSTETTHPPNLTDRSATESAEKAKTAESTETIDQLNTNNGSLENGSSSLENGSSSLENGSSSLENGSSSLENGSSSLENGSSSLENKQAITETSSKTSSEISSKNTYPDPDPDAHEIFPDSEFPAKRGGGLENSLISDCADENSVAPEIYSGWGSDEGKSQIRNQDSPSVKKSDSGNLGESRNLVNDKISTPQPPAAPPVKKPEIPASNFSAVEIPAPVNPVSDRIAEDPATHFGDQRRADGRMPEELGPVDRLMDYVDVHPDNEIRAMYFDDWKRKGLIPWYVNGGARIDPDFALWVCKVAFPADQVEGETKARLIDKGQSHIASARTDKSRLLKLAQRWLSYEKELEASQAELAATESTDGSGSRFTKDVMAFYNGESMYRHANVEDEFVPLHWLEGQPITIPDMELVVPINASVLWRTGRMRDITDRQNAIKWLDQVERSNVALAEGDAPMLGTWIQQLQYHCVPYHPKNRYFPSKKLKKLFMDVYHSEHKDLLSAGIQSAMRKLGARESA